MKIPDRNDLKLGKIVVLDSLWKPIKLIFVSRRQGSGIPDPCLFEMKINWLLHTSTGHHFELMAHRHICGTDTATKFKFCAQMHYARLLPADCHDIVIARMLLVRNARPAPNSHQVIVECATYTILVKTVMIRFD